MDNDYLMVCNSDGGFMGGFKGSELLSAHLHSLAGFGAVLVGTEGGN